MGIGGSPSVGVKSPARQMLLSLVLCIATFAPLINASHPSPTMGRRLPSVLTLSEMETAMVEGLIELRASHGLSLLCISPSLTQAARDTVARALACGTPPSSHHLCDGSEPEERLAASGYTVEEGLFEPLMGYAQGCRKDDRGCGAKAIKLWREDPGASGVLEGTQWLQVGLAGGRGEDGEFVFAGFVGAVPGPWCAPRNRLGGERREQGDSPPRLRGGQ